MTRSNSLRSRIIQSYLLLSFLICSCFVFVFLLVESYAEKVLIYDAMSAELERIIERGGHRPGDELTPGMTLYFGKNVPEYLAALEPRSEVYEVNYGDLELAVLVRRVNTQTYLVVDDQSAFERVEVTIVMALGAASIVSLLLSIVFSKALTGRVILPLTQLTDLVQSGKLSESALVHCHDEIGFLAQAIDERNNRLNQYWKREKVFTGDVSHELRTPLTIILGAAEVLQSRYTDMLESDSHQYIERIRHTAIETTDRISALLLLARSPDHMGGPRVVLNQLVGKEVERYRYLLKGKPVRFELDLNEEVWIYVRPELAGIAIGNLIRNACQYTDDGKIRISLTGEQCVVEDTGYGVPGAIRSDLFERFVRGDLDDQTGTGLGLSIVKRVCDHVGWSVSYEPLVESGSRFTIFFRIDPILTKS